VRSILQSEYELRVEEDEDLCILSIDHNSTLWQRGSAHVKTVLTESRGTVIEKVTGRVVCLPFHKFWNAGEGLASTAHMDWSSAFATEKVDGTFVKLFHYKGQWRLAGNRSLNVHDKQGKYACTGRTNYELFAEAAEGSGLDYSRLNPQHTYLFERVHPDFTIVIVPQAAKLWHLATRDMRTLQEEDEDCISLQSPPLWKVSSLANARTLLELLPGEREGLVIHDGAHRRVKLKRAEYVLMHMEANGCSNPDYSWVARAGGHAARSLPVDRLCLAVWLRREAEELLAYYPEHRARYQQIVRALESRAFRAEGWMPTDARAREGARFAHEPRLWAAISMLVV